MAGGTEEEGIVIWIAQAIGWVAFAATFALRSNDLIYVLLYTTAAVAWVVSGLLSLRIILGYS